MISGFDDRLVDIIHAHPSTTLATRDRALVSTMSRGFGTRVIEGGAEIEVVVSRWPGPNALDNMLENGRVAVTFTVPETFASFQVKGRFLSHGACTQADLELVDVYTRTIRRRIEALDESALLAETTFAWFDPFMIRFAPEVVFDQTPGQNAGRRL
jgi:hypothetical protein